MGEPMLSIDTAGDVSVVRVHTGKLYQNESMRFREEMLNFLGTEHKKVVLDLSRVRVMNSSAIGVVLLAADYLKGRRGRLAVGGLNPMLMELFKRMYLHTLFVVADTPEQAVTSLSGRKKNPAT
jgi:anti-anti-sigma factor